MSPDETGSGAPHEGTHTKPKQSPRGRQKRGAGLFNGHWENPDGSKGERIKREEYPELYRLHRLCTNLEKAGLLGPAPRRHHTGVQSEAPGRARAGTTGEANPFH